MSSTTRKSQTTIYIDREKWNEVSRRIPNMTLSFFVDHYLSNLLTLLIEKGISLEDIYSEAANQTLEQAEVEP